MLLGMLCHACCVCYAFDLCHNAGNGKSCLAFVGRSTDRPNGSPYTQASCSTMSSAAQAVCHALRALYHCCLQPLRQAYGETRSRGRSSDSTSHLLVLSLLIRVHEIIVVLLIVIAPAGLRIVLQLLLYFAIIGCLACLTSRALVEDIAQVELFVFKVFVVAFFFGCALQVGVSDWW